MNHNSLRPQTKEQAKVWNRYNTVEWDWIPMRYWPYDIALAVMTKTLNYESTFRWFIYLMGNGLSPEEVEGIMEFELSHNQHRLDQVRGLLRDVDKKASDWTYWDETDQRTLSLADTKIIKSVNSRRRQYVKPRQPERRMMPYKKSNIRKTSGYDFVNGELAWVGQREYEIEEQNQVVDDPDRNPFLPKAEIKMVEGNVFYGTSDYALVHCIAKDAAMGAGIAVNFKSKYPDMPAYVKKQKPDIGSCVMYTSKFGQVVMNLVTKDKSSGKPTLASLSRSLEALKTAVIYNKIKKLAMPKIGSGLDRLDWNKVLEQIELVFWDVDIEIKIFTPKKYWNKF